MRLKKLEITGFKSFLEKTKVIFPPGISAVVGPNGCGKSNIVDALRWVMGEQSIKQLRGKAKEDIIFAGADGKKQVNMAEVSLLVENTLKAASEPLNDYSEIMITRRLYRSGESAYLINRQPCRLKDIHDLFLGSGTGKNSFAVIQQGNIGAITDASPEERRYFIEEAADITKYKTRKKETLAKVKATSENLLRISDISAEIKRQINALNRQAKKAERFKDYRARIKYLEIKIALWKFDGFTERIREIETSLESYRKTQGRGITTLAACEAELAETRGIFLTKTNQIEELKTRQFETRRAIDKYENDIAHYQKNRQTLGDEIIESQKQRDELRVRNKEVKEEISQAETGNADIHLKIQAAEEDLESAVKRYNEVKKSLSAFEEELKNLNSTHMRLAGENAKYKNILINAKKREEDIVRRLKIVAEDVFTGQTKSQALQGKRNELYARKKEADDFLEEIRDDLKKISGKLDEKKMILEKHRDALKLLEIEHSRITSRHQTLAKMHERYEWFQDGVKAVMESRFNDKTAVLGVLADLITPVNGYEKAVETVLGEALQYIIVDHLDTGVSLATFLTEGNKGRGVFVPSTIENGELKTPPTLTRLIDCVEYPETYRGIMRYLLGNCVVTDTFSEAVELKNSSAEAIAVVSKTGEMISEKGIITGGKNTGNVSILEKKQELRSLEEAILETEKKIEQAADTASELDTGIERLLSKEKALKDELNDTEKEKNDIDKSLYQADSEAAQAERRLEIAELEKEQLTGEHYDIEDEIEVSRNRLSGIEADIERTNQATESVKSKNKDVSENLESLNQQSVDIRLSITSLNAQNESYQGSLSRLRTFLTEGLDRCARLEDDIQAKIETSQNTGQLLEKISNELDHSRVALEEVTHKLDLAQADCKDVEMRLSKTEGKISECKDENEKTLDQMRELQINLSEFQVKREALTARIEEKYHHRLNQYQLEFEAAGKGDKPVTEFDITCYESELSDLSMKIRRLGDVNLGAISEFEELKIRYDFMLKQHDDLTASLDDLEKIIEKINSVSEERFLKTFNAINEKLSGVFARLFEGGTAQMVLTEPSKPLETGVELMIKPPGKTLTRLSLLSGGEKALSAIAFVFSVFLIKPASFCIMDEIDAPLDDSNVVRFNHLVKMIGEQSQILIITHNKLTMEFADILFGVTMEKKGVSKIVSVTLTKGGEEAAENSEVA